MTKISCAVVCDRPWTLYVRIEGELPKRPNEMLGRGVFTARTNAKKWKLMVSRAVILTRPERPLMKAKLTIIRHSSNMVDFDSLCGQQKPIVDGLTEGKIITDDRWSVIGTWNIDQKYRPRAEGSLVELWVEDAL